MSRYYKAITDHVPIDYESDLDAIGQYFEGKGKDFRSLHTDWKLRALEFDDSAALIEQLKRRIVRFALDCNANPQRTPLQLLATAKSILKDPEAFVHNPGTYDPEVSAMVYGALSSRSDEVRDRLEAFEWGRGPAPRPEEVTRAAEIVVAKLRFEAAEIPTVGGQTLALQRELAKDFAQIFENFGGHVSRITRFKKNDYPLSEYSEDGPFQDFLKIVLPPALPFAKKAGFKMQSIRSLVAIVLDSRVTE